MKYNKKNGSISTSSAVEKLDENRILLKVVIADTGIGMSKEFQKHLFDPFTREHEGNMGKSEGTGLGMSIVRQLIDKMGEPYRWRAESMKIPDLLWSFPLKSLL